MKIAQIAPPWIAVPPPGYGGIEWVVALLADGLVARGHDVTLFASGGSRTDATLSTVFDPAPGPEAIGDTYLEASHTFAAYERADEFDLIHDHTSLVGLALGTRTATPVVHTIHGLLDQAWVRWYAMLSGRIHFVSISDRQRLPAPDLSYAGRVYNGIRMDAHPLVTDKEEFLFFVGRANPDKGCHVAVEVAKRTGRKLVMAVAIKTEAERTYWAEQVEPLLTGSEDIRGEITLEQKAGLMGRAHAVLFPIDWEEPFGLVMAEANACGTPVLAFPRGAAPEVIADGVTGFLCADTDAMVAAVERAGEIDPSACRAHVQQHFSAEAMTAGYEQVYRSIMSIRT